MIKEAFLFSLFHGVYDALDGAQASFTGGTVKQNAQRVTTAVKNGLFSNEDRLAKKDAAKKALTTAEPAHEVVTVEDLGMVISAINAVQTQVNGLAKIVKSTTKPTAKTATKTATKRRVKKS